MSSNYFLNKTKMENKTKKQPTVICQDLDESLDSGETKESIFSNKIIMGMIGLTGLALAYVLGSNIIKALPGANEQPYISKTPNYEIALERMRTRHEIENCEAEKAIALSNWEDASHGIHIGKDMNQIQLKKNKDCSRTFLPPIQ